ncbi:MAG: UDP-N-acetylmuramoyl-tripeptide--D-alanyl-D-alanine ligase [Armatimonadetes bacterium]|nr:UDP-N-acetylmuramoyl-tripeptide--D-alanyl-D-alanine ligase [Armatimonadota bacterium]
MEFTLAWAAAAMGAAPIDTDQTATGVCMDSRQSVEGRVFFALAGTNTDGHAFVADALARGAAAAVVSQKTAGTGARQILVESPIAALGALARAWRQQFKIPVVGITGSVGKTSVRSMAAAVARARYRTLESSGNLNTEVGVPLTLFGIDAQTEIAILELAMRGPGQIRELCEIADPNVAAITGIGSTHLGLLGSRSAIAAAKAEILDSAPAVAVLPAHDEFFPMLRDRVTAESRLITFSTDPAVPADVVLRRVATMDSLGSSAHIEVLGAPAALRITMPGTHHIRNAVAALAIGAAIGVDVEAAVEALAAWRGVAGRMTVRKAGGITLLDDCYNAAPESMEAALATLAVVEPDAAHRVVILGDMLELGEVAAEAHALLGKQVADLRVRLLITVGAFGETVLSEVRARRSGIAGASFATAAEAAAAVREMTKLGDTVLVKGSRGIALEAVVRRLEAEPDA